MLIRPANPEDARAIWSIIQPIIRAGEAYALDRDMSEDDALGYWLGSDKETFVAEEDGAILRVFPEVLVVSPAPVIALSKPTAS